MAASGVNPLAKGMSFGQQQLVAYDFGNDGSEMLNEAANLLVSNHSYGSLSGWEFNNNRWSSGDSKEPMKIISLAIIPMEPNSGIPLLTMRLFT